MDYKKVIDTQIKDLGETIKDQKAEHVGNSSRFERGLSYVVDKAFSPGEENYVQKGAKTTLVTGAAFAAGVILPIVSGGTLAVLALIGYGGKKFVYEPIKNKTKKEA